MNDNYLPDSYWESEWDGPVTDEQLLFEFEKMIQEDKKKLPPIPKNDPDNCYHVWEVVGSGPVTDTPWFNCKYCKIRKEDYEKSK